MDGEKRQANVLVLTVLFPNANQPNAGVFIRERMFRVGERMPLLVVAPVPWFPFQNIARRVWPHFRPAAPRYEQQAGVDVYHPRFFSIPKVIKCLDGLFMALCIVRTIRRLQAQGRVDVIDAHFGYPDGYAATCVGKWLNIPVSVTLRGTEVPHARTFLRRYLLRRGLERAQHIFAVSTSLKCHAEELGINSKKVEVIGNGVDPAVFYPEPKRMAREYFGLPIDAHVLITVGGLVERKGFHRVIDLLPRLREEIHDLHYLVVGGASAEGNWGKRLKQQVVELGLERAVHFCGPLPSSKVRLALSAADVFVLASRNEGWANVILEAMACGLPVVASDVGGNNEVIAHQWLGDLVPFGDKAALYSALRSALRREWDVERIVKYAQINSWDERVSRLVQRLEELAEGGVNNE
jgi:teichuronic acid biosynthesis glycosyltransferase TuaC